MQPSPARRGQAPPARSAEQRIRADRRHATCSLAEEQVTRPLMERGGAREVSQLAGSSGSREPADGTERVLRAYPARQGPGG
jgi:hypothetical protein